jgi:hypothetical protein
VHKGEVSHIRHDISKGVKVLSGGWCKDELTLRIGIGFRPSPEVISASGRNDGFGARGKLKQRRPGEGRDPSLHADR